MTTRQPLVLDPVSHLPQEMAPTDSVPVPPTVAAFMSAALTTTTGVPITTIAGDFISVST